MLSRYSIAISYKKQPFCLPYHVGQVHRKTALSFYIGHIRSILKANRHSLTNLPHFPKMDANRAR